MKTLFCYQFSPKDQYKLLEKDKYQRRNHYLKAAFGFFLFFRNRS